MPNTRTSPQRTRGFVKKTKAATTIQRHTRKVKNYDTCVICYDKILPSSNDEKSCNIHKNHFHKECMIQYLTTDNKLRCPLCRNKVNLNSNTKEILKILEENDIKNISKELIKMINDLENHKDAAYMVSKLKTKMSFFIRGVRNLTDLYKNPNQVILLLTKMNFNSVKKGYILQYIEGMKAIKKEIYDKIEFIKRNEGLLSLKAYNDNSKKSKSNKSAPGDIGLMHHNKNFQTQVPPGVF